MICVYFQVHVCIRLPRYRNSKGRLGNIMVVNIYLQKLRYPLKYKIGRLLLNNNETNKVCYLLYILSIFSWLVKNCVVHQNTVFNSLKFLYIKGYDRRKMIGLMKKLRKQFVHQSLVNKSYNNKTLTNFNAIFIYATEKDCMMKDFQLLQ